MIESIKELFHQFARMFIWWVIIVPWEQAVRVRLGSHMIVLESGIHLKIPYIDLIYRQSIRRRVIATPMQTLNMSNNAKIITIASQIIYAIEDIKKLYQTLHHPEDTLSGLTQSKISEFIFSSTSENCTPQKLRDYLREELDFSEFGLSGVDFFVTNFAIVKTYRLIMDKLREYPANELWTNTHDGE